MIECYQEVSSDLERKNSRENDWLEEKAVIEVAVGIHEIVERGESEVFRDGDV
jgi:hypothetical protein